MRKNRKKKGARIQTHQIKNPANTAIVDASIAKDEVPICLEAPLTAAATVCAALPSEVPEATATLVSDSAVAPACSPPVEVERVLPPAATVGALPC